MMLVSEAPEKAAWITPEVVRLDTNETLVFNGGAGDSNTGS